MAMVDHDRAVMAAARMGVSKSKDNDAKLGELAVVVGMLAACDAGSPFTQETLKRIFGFTFGWLMRLGHRRPQSAINDERDRQDKLFVEGKILFNCASPVADFNRKLRVLVEEVGEVAQAIDKVEWSESRGAGGDASIWRKELKTELTQVAAVVAGWLESYEVKK